ncbi:MAG: hypothetical protein ACLFVO_27785 [Chloroflexaceae bacterium]
MDIHKLQRYDPQAVHAPTHALDDRPGPPRDQDVLLIGAGNSGETVTLRCQALGYRDGRLLPAIGINNDRLAPRAVTVCQDNGTPVSLALTDRLVLDGENPRDQLTAYPLLEERYGIVLRGIPVFETYPRAGAGGHGHPVIAALDIDLHITEVLALLRRAIRGLRDLPPDVPGQSAVQRLIARYQQRQDAAPEKHIVVIGGACGAMGNATHHLLPYLIRTVLAEHGITRYQLWGVVLGPQAFTGLTPFVRHNYRAVLEALEHMSRAGQQRTYLNDLTIRMQRPPYDRVFLLDDPTLPGEYAGVTEAELDHFLDRAAVSLSLLLRGTVWQTIASHIANDDGVPREDGRLRYLNTIQGVLIGADRAHLTEVLTRRVARTLLDQFCRRFAA